MPLRFLGKIDAFYPDLGTTMNLAVDDPFAATSRRQAGDGAAAAWAVSPSVGELVRGMRITVIIPRLSRAASVAKATLEWDRWGWSIPMASNKHLSHMN